MSEYCNCKCNILNYLLLIYLRLSSDGNGQNRNLMLMMRLWFDDATARTVKFDAYA